MMIFAHRGGKALGPENTIGTMQKAIAAGAHGLEMDIRCSLDDMPVLMHDASVDRTTNGSGEVYRITAEALARLDAGEGRAVPMLSKVLDTFRDEKATLMLELKHPATALPTAQVVQTFIEKKNLPNHRIIITTFYHQLLALIHDKYPKLVTGALLKKIPESLAACGEYTKSHYVLPPIDMVNDAFVNDAIARDVKVIPWVADSQAQIDKARKLGVYGIVTSDPTIVRD
jgi:glycerophosphoryl diester phosphodiesterase